MMLGQRLFRLLFPPKCVLCGKLLQEEETCLCRRCRTEEPHVEGYLKRGRFYDRCWAVYYYSDRVRQSVHRFKFRGQPQYARIYGQQMAMLLLRERVDFDILTWVPVSRKRLRQRGYDQCLLLAQAVAQELGTTCLSTLEKFRHTPSQTTLASVAERQANVKNAFRVTDPAMVAGKRILLIDDILTTGATLTECAGILRLAGAAHVECIVVAAVRKEQQ